MSPLELRTDKSADGITWIRRWRFAILLAILVAFLVGSPVLTQFGMSSNWFDAMMIGLIFCSVLSLCVDARQRLFALAFGVPTMLLMVGGLSISGDLGNWVVLLRHLSSIIFLFGAAGLIVKSLFSSDAPSLDRMIGAICGYLFLGLGWAMSHTVVENYQPGSYRVSWLANSGGTSEPLDSLVLVYYSFVTLTTVGYGDVTPASATSRTLAWIEAISGQFYLAVIVAGLVSILGSTIHRRRENREP